MQLKPIEELSPRRQRRRLRNVEALTAASRRVFEQKGYVDATVQDIIEAADVGRGTFYNYFESKEAVFQALLQELIDEFIVAGTEVGAERSVRTRIELAMRGVLERADANRELLRAVRQAINVNGEFSVVWGALRTRFGEFIKRDLDWCLSHGMLDPVNTEILALVLSGMIETMLFDGVDARSYDLAELESVMVDLYWNAVFRPHEGAHDYEIRPGKAPLVRMEPPKNT